jgi:hypothetical protein
MLAASHDRGLSPAAAFARIAKRRAVAARLSSRMIRAHQDAGDASGLPFSTTKVSISLLPDIEQAS